MPASVASVSFSFTPCVSLCGHLSPFPADGVSHLKGTDFNHLRKVEMSWCPNLSPSLIAAICCSSSLEELVVTSGLEVSVSSVCLTTPCIQTALLQLTAPQNHASTFVWLHLTGEALPLTGGSPHDAVQLSCSYSSSLQFAVLTSTVLYSL